MDTFARPPEPATTQEAIKRMASDSKHPKKHTAHEKPHARAGGLTPLAIGLIVALVLVAAGVAYVVATQPAGTSASAVAPHPSKAPAPSNGSFQLPKQVELTGNSSCPVNDKVPVLLFTDPYCPACAQTEPQVSAFYDQYKDRADIQYRIVATHSRSLAQAYGKDEVYIAHDYFVCANEQAKLPAFKKCFYQNLTYQSGEYIPETKAQLQACANAVPLNQTQLDACLLVARAKIDAANVEAASFGGGSFFTPMAVVDCQYRVNSVLAEQTYCAVSKAC